MDSGIPSGDVRLIGRRIHECGNIAGVFDAQLEDPSLAVGIGIDQGKGWLFKIKSSAPSDIDALMTPEAYQSHIG